MKALSDFLIFLLMVVGGVILEEITEVLYFRLTKKKFKEHHFSFSKYIYLLLFPLLATIVILQRNSSKLALVFLTFSFFGTVMEWLIGFFYHKIVGQRLWTYHRYSWMGYTSWLCLPLWGFAGVLFWLLARVFI
ncbi:hypothetical protein HZA76_02035 [Candidatus Roizmanbacteria bacterium]|nr:hypothetical protein [Candidatus Roizmanbacteria bacterium]